MHEELVDLGRIFREQRELKHLSLREVENATSIRQVYLEAIEAGHMGKLISPIYAQGFIKKYASFLQLDGDQLMQQYPYVQQILQESRATTEDFSFGIGSLETRGSPGSDVKWLPNLMWIGLSVALIVTGWFLARKFGLF